MDLIDRAAVMQELEREVELADDWKTAHEVANVVKYAPTIEAVPLDKLCEWLAGWDIQVIPCNVCKNVFQLESCPHGPFDCGDSEHLKMLIKKWMEGQHET